MTSPSSHPSTLFTSLGHQVNKHLLVTLMIFLRQLGTLTPLNVSNLFHKRLNEMDAFEMIRAVSDKEIKDAVFSMGNDKSPGPDCFTADFFKEAWDIVATHVISSIYDLFLFAHGDANSASVIMSALDEFKQQIMRGFLWCHGSLSRGKAKVAWEIVCLPKVEGGLGKYLMLSSIPDPITVPSTRDVLEWCDSYGTAKEFSLKTVWGSIRPRSNKVVWCHAVWFPECIPRHAFHLWLVIKRRLKTHDRLRAWDHVWYEMKGFASLPNSSSSNDAILNDIYPFAMKKTSRSVIAKLVLCMVYQHGVYVKDPVTIESVKSDEKSIGEIMFRGNTVMSGYLKDPKATKDAFVGGWFISGDIGIKHRDGYIEVKDRLKDIVISGGENISTIEVESVIYRRQALLEVVVVARPDDHWGQTPCAFVKLKEGYHADAQEIIQHCRDHMPHYMSPRTVIFQDLPRNLTSKVEQFTLRDEANNLGNLVVWISDLGKCCGFCTPSAWDLLLTLLEAKARAPADHGRTMCQLREIVKTCGNPLLFLHVVSERKGSSPTNPSCSLVALNPEESKPGRLKNNANDDAI
ncbi:AMP-binding, conserved site-containing protein [Tanacetum coccineum]